MLSGDLEVRVDETAGGHPAETDEDFRAQKRGLLLEPADAGILLLRQGIAVFGRAAFHDVGDIQVILPGQADSGQHFIQKLATPPDKGFPLEVFVFTGSLAHEENLGVWYPHPEDHVGAGGGKPAGCTGAAADRKFLE